MGEEVSPVNAVSLTDKVVAAASAESSMVKSVRLPGFVMLMAPPIPLRLPALPIVTVLSALPTIASEPVVPWTATESLSAPVVIVVLASAIVLVTVIVFPPLPALKFRVVMPKPNVIGEAEGPQKLGVAQCDRLCRRVPGIVDGHRADAAGIAHSQRCVDAR